ncbi:CUB and sushi domain-containing protein 1-like isoform X2 [Eriocheir sinensis]|uniref:CUB and sushi domain-containing protein 1-like isoform X2 n=1 Tax=Eriocheir sinensis TaxID=95602 RepID=UPI0021C644C3|nr:CUB and sushi domain-containing protein 1-like isoform X2 [Eriocheir sinensis]
MTYQNVSIVLSPTMQISHRVLNVFFLNRAYLFGGVAIKKFRAPSRTRELTVLASGQVAKMSGGTARHFLKKALLPLTGWCDSLLLLEVQCPNLTTTLTTALSVVVEDSGRVEATADYSCEKGRIVGNSQRKCGSNGIWSGSQPRCEYVTCDLPQGLDNGRIVRLNQTLEYGSLVEYHCLPEHRLVGGTFRRSCGELGEWLGGEPKCVLGPEDAYNTIGSDSSSSSVSTTSTSTASNTGLYIGLFFGLILAIVFIGVLVYFRMSVDDLIEAVFLGKVHDSFCLGPHVFRSSIHTLQIPVC